MKICQTNEKNFSLNQGHNCFLFCFFLDDKGQRSGLAKPSSISLLIEGVAHTALIYTGRKSHDLHAETPSI
jgi:hypothetical protein